MAKNIKVIDSMSNNVLLILPPPQFGDFATSQKTNEGILQVILSFIFRDIRVPTASEMTAT